MLTPLEELTPAEREAWGEVEAAERALELAQLRLMAVTERSRRRRGHLRLVLTTGAIDGTEARCGD
jgi:hypothetical protein